MIRTPLRILAGLILVATASLAAVLAYKVLVTEELTRELSLGALLYDLNPHLLNLVQSFTQRYISPAFWDQIIVPLLLMQARIALACAAAISMAILLVARRR